MNNTRRNARNQIMSEYHFTIYVILHKKNNYNKQISIQWNPSCEATPFAPKK